MSLSARLISRTGCTTRPSWRSGETLFTPVQATGRGPPEEGAVHDLLRLPRRSLRARPSLDRRTTGVRRWPGFNGNVLTRELDDVVQVVREGSGQQGCGLAHRRRCNRVPPSPEPGARGEPRPQHRFIGAPTAFPRWLPPCVCRGRASRAWATVLPEGREAKK